MSEAQSFEEIASLQGWNDWTVTEILRRFIAAKALTHELELYAAKVAARENEET